MPQTVNINGVAISYPVIGDTEWGVEATKFAELVGVVLQKIGQGNQSTTNNIVIGSISSPGNLTVASGNLSVSGNTALTGILNVDSGTLYVDPTNNRVGINDSSPSEALDVVGNALVSGTLGVTGVITGASATLTNLTVDTNLIKTDSANDRVGINTTSPQEALDVTGKILVSSDLTVGGVIVADDSTNVTTAPPIAFTGDLNTGIGHSAADTLDFVTNAVSRARISSTGLQSSVVPDLSGSNTTLFPEYKCRAWVNFNGSGAVGAQVIRGSGNVTSVARTADGEYTINFVNPLPDANYACVCSGGSTASGTIYSVQSISKLTDSTQIQSLYYNGPFLQRGNLLNIEVVVLR